MAEEVKRLNLFYYILCLSGADEMKVQDRFQEMLLPVSRKIKKECNYNSKSCTDELSFIRLGFKSIKKELMETLKIIVLLNPSAKEWEKIRETGGNFLELQINTIINGYSPLCEHSGNHQSDIAFLKREVIAEFNAFIDGQLKEIIRRRKKIFSDLLIKIISGIVGGLIVYFLTKPFLW
jgi:hypothetical protein